MEKNKLQKMRRVANYPRQRAAHEDFRSLLKKLQKMMDTFGYGPSRARAQPARCQEATCSAHSNQRGILNVRTNFERNKVPAFNSYEEYHKMALRSFENISIVMNIDGKVVFISENVSPLLGYHPEELIGMSLLNIILDEEKEEISQKIILNLPLADSVGSLVEFCCYVRRGNAGCNAQERSNYMCAYQRRDTYEYVKFILYLQDCYDESFVFFGKYGGNSRSISSSATKQLWEQQYYLVGTISVLRPPDESEQPIKVLPDVILIGSDDDSTVPYNRTPKDCQKNVMQSNCQAEASNVACPDSPPEVEIVGFRPANWKKPFEVIQIRTSSESSISTCISEDTSTSTSISSTEITETGPTFGQGSMTDLKYMQEPVDIEFEVDPEFLLSDSQDEQGSSEQGKCSDVDTKKLLEEAKASNLKEHVIDEYSVPLNAPSDNDYCEVIEITEDQKEPEDEELVEQEQEKAPETSLKFPSTTVPRRPEALVEPMVRADLQPRRSFQFQRPLLGERFAQLSGPRVRTQVYDLNISRTFHDESSSYEDIQEEEREREQCVYELSQRIEMFRNLLPEPQQTGQGQDYSIYRPRDQVVTVIDDVGPRHINLFGNNNSEYPQNETDRFQEDPFNRTPSVLCVPSTRSCQTITVLCHTSPESNHPLTTAQHQSAASHDPTARSQNQSARVHVGASQSSRASSDQREGSPHVLSPGQENSGFFRLKEIPTVVAHEGKRR